MVIITGEAENPGCKEIPIGKENFLNGKKFVISGRMMSLHRDEAKCLIEKYGGKVLTGLFCCFIFCLSLFTRFKFFEN